MFYVTYPSGHSLLVNRLDDDYPANTLAVKYSCHSSETFWLFDGSWQEIKRDQYESMGDLEEAKTYA